MLKRVHFTLFFTSDIEKTIQFYEGLVVLTFKNRRIKLK